MRMRSSPEENVKIQKEKKELLTTIALATCIYLLRIRVKKAVAVGIIIAGITNDSRHKSPWKPPWLGTTMNGSSTETARAL